MKKFWIGFLVGALFQATAGTLIAMNLEKAWPESTHVLVNLMR